VLFIALLVVLFLLVAAGQRGGETFFSHPALALVAIGSAAAAIAGGVIALGVAFHDRPTSLLGRVAVVAPLVAILFWGLGWVVVAFGADRELALAPVETAWLLLTVIGIVGGLVAAFLGRDRRVLSAIPLTLGMSWASGSSPRSSATASAANPSGVQASLVGTCLGTVPRPVRRGQYGPRVMRLVVARCEVTYTGRLDAHLPEAVRLLLFKADGSVLVHDDAGGYKPLNWMTPPTVLEEAEQAIVVRKPAGKSEDRLEIRIAEVLSEVTHDMGESAALQKDGIERHLQEELAARPDVLGELRLVRREWPTDIGPVDLMCRDESGAWVAVEIKRIGTIDAVEQLSRYLERIELDGCRGMLAAQVIKPQARTLAESRGIACVEVDLAVLRGLREPELTLFTAV
jgi:hypothetical protein